MRGQDAQGVALQSRHAERVRADEERGQPRQHRRTHRHLHLHAQHRVAADGVRGGGQPEGLPAAQPAQPPPQLFLFLRRPAAADQGADLPRPRLRLPPDRQRHELPGAEEVRAQGPGGAERAGDARVRHEDLRLRAGEERRLQGLLPEEDQGPPALQVDGPGGADRERLHPRHRRLVVRRPAVGGFHAG